MANKKNGMGKGVAAAAAMAAAAVGAYWFYGSKEAAKHRKSARSWMLKARGEVLEAVETVVEKAGEIDKEKYMNIVGDVVKRYSSSVGATKQELGQMTKDMKAAWQHVQKVSKKGLKKAAKIAKKKIG